MSIRAHSQPPALSQCPAPPLLVSVKPRKCGKNQEKRLICINLEPGNPGAAELGLQGWGAAFFGGGYPKKISSFPGEALLAAHLFPGKAGLGGSGWAPNIPKKNRSWILLEDSPGGSRLFAMETERCQGIESPKIPSFWGSRLRFSTRAEKPLEWGDPGAGCGGIWGGHRAEPTTP